MVIFYLKFFEIIGKFNKINKLLEEEKTGNANKFAVKVGLSKSRLYDYLDYFKSYDIKIEYQPKKDSFVLEEGVEIEILHPVRVLKNNELISTGGGEKIIARVRGNRTGWCLSLGLNQVLVESMNSSKPISAQW